MKTLDLRKRYRPFYQASSRLPELVEVPELHFLTIDGRIEPGASPSTSKAFQAAVQALYGAAYTLKFAWKKRKTGALDWPVMPLEAIWWIEKGAFDIARPGNWCWRAMILQPEQVTADALGQALAQLREKKKASPAIEHLVLRRFEEGLSVQMLHVGPYATEPATVEKMRAFAEAHALVERHDRVKRGLLAVHDHHEIYLSDPRRTVASKLKTVIRHPVRRSG